MRKPPLLVHLVFHPESVEARELARQIHLALNDDPALPGLRIPTIFCREQENNAPPTDYDLDQAQCSFIIPLADGDLYLDDQWCSFVADLWEKCDQSGHRCVPVQLIEEAWPLDKRLNGVNFIRAFAESEKSQLSFVVRRIVTELCRYLHGDQLGDDSAEAPTKMFVSHTKLDTKEKPRVVDKLKKYLKSDQPIKTWFDSGDIAAGSRFAKEIDQGIEDSSLLCVLTNNYASREWCRKEILLAKEKQRPIAVIDALSNREARSFPYLGNLPVMRWGGKAEAAIDLLLKETLRHLHSKEVLKQWKQDDNDELFSRAPELLTVVKLADNKRVLYPDPPLGVEEICTLENAGVTVTTPLERLAAEKPLRGKRVAISMSESTDLHRFGFDLLHFEAAMLELTRYILLKGVTLAYGGHLGSEGYTEKLTELVRMYNQQEGVDPVNLLENYIGWPLPWDKKIRIAYKSKAKLIRTPRPEGLDEQLHQDFLEEPKFFPAEKSPLHRYAWARGMTEMRVKETEACEARIVLGGVFGPTIGIAPDGSKKEKWYSSRIPGVLEEILLSLKADQPIFLIGAFGGVASMVIDILEGQDRKEMSWEYQKQAPAAEGMRALYQDRNETWWDYPEMVEFIRKKGIKGLNPNLTEDEHKELFHTKDVMRMVELIVKGLG